MSPVPPKLESYTGLKVYSVGGDNNWLSFDKTKLYTNAYVISDGKILLGFKKRGYGKHKYNGFGGKAEPGESAKQAATRELKEESGLDADPVHCGTLFYGQEGYEHIFQIELFRVDSYTGEPTDTDEMRPEWFALEPEGDNSYPPIPWGKMWSSDKYWLPLVFTRQHFVARSDVTLSVEDGLDNFTLQRWWVGTKQ